MIITFWTEFGLLLQTLQPFEDHKAQIAWSPRVCGLMRTLGLNQEDNRQRVGRVEPITKGTTAACTKHQRGLS